MACINNGCKECRTDAQCTNLYHDSNYICKDNSCHYNECSTNSDCVTKYSHLYSCVNNKCTVTCNWGIITNAGKNILEGTGQDLIARMTLEKNNTTTSLGSYSSLNNLYHATGNRNKTINAASLKTCVNGVIANCPYIEATESGDVIHGDLTAPCIPCSAISGGGYGVTSTQTSDIGTTPYAFQSDYVLTRMEQRSFIGLMGGGSTSQMRCVTNVALTSSLNIDEKLENSIGLLEASHDISFNASGPLPPTYYPLGFADICAFNPMISPKFAHNGFSSAYASSHPHPEKHLLTTTGTETLVLFPKQNKSLNMFSRSSFPGGNVKIPVNLSIQNVIACCSWYTHNMPNPECMNLSLVNYE